MGILALILIAIMIYGFVELYRKNNDLGGWFDALLDIVDKVLS